MAARIHESGHRGAPRGIGALSAHRSAGARSGRAAGGAGARAPVSRAIAKPALVAAVAIACLPGRAAGQAPSRTTWDGIYTAEQARRGSEIYTATCASCHGPRLDGIDAAPGLNGGPFYSNWNGVPLHTMAERVRISMPQNAPGTLGRQEVADVLAYIFSQNGMPPGDRELPRQLPFLRDIAFLPTKPGN